METQNITESIILADASNVDKEERIIRNVSVLGKFSNNAKGGREYSSNAHESAVRVLEGSSIFEGHKKATQKNCKMVLAAVTKDVKRVLDITKMSSKLEIIEDLESAQGSFG